MESITKKDLEEVLGEFQAKNDYKFSEVLTEIKAIKASVSELQKGSLTSDEKEELLSFIRPVDEFLVNKELGKTDITLTRAEYDKVQKIAGFRHRFKSAHV